MSPNELLLCLNCASAFSWFLYIFHLTAVKKNLTNAKPDTADPWVSNSRESQKQETREGAGEQDTREGASWLCLWGHHLVISCQSWADSQQDLTLSRGGCLRYLSLQWKTESNTFQGSSKASTLWTVIALKEDSTFHSARHGEVLGKGLESAGRLQKHELGNDCQREERRKDRYRGRSVSTWMWKSRPGTTVPNSSLGPVLLAIMAVEDGWLLLVSDLARPELLWGRQHRKGLQEGKDGAEQNLLTGQSEPPHAAESTGGKKAKNIFSLASWKPNRPFLVWVCPRHIVSRNISHIQLIWTDYIPMDHNSFHYLLCPGRCTSTCKSRLLISEALKPLLWELQGPSPPQLSEDWQGTCGNSNLRKSDQGPWCRSQRYLLKASSSFVLTIQCIPHVQQGKS